MRISCENGDITIADTKEVILLILSLAEKGMNEIWISEDGSLYPALAVLVNGGYACLNYFGNDEGDMYMSRGYGNTQVTFNPCGTEWTAPADAVISIESAVACIRRFCENYKLPDCINWQDGV
ncbi:Imm1 family immunity protein [Ruminococcus albus]|uniref:Immunity protein Imm1 n=1 Tax=Ruminococcus albus TaxID=1264 RepID=A0A1H7FF19_RUMAL|nr:Imm1 family immunity protein [Ruminococcus albus]SEK23012.1 Immunity protein Imm1 [Ruminococcus albus]